MVIVVEGDVSDRRKEALRRSACKYGPLKCACVERAYVQVRNDRIDLPDLARNLSFSFQMRQLQMTSDVDGRVVRV